GGVARCRAQSRVSEAGEAEACQQWRDRGERKPLLQVALVVGKHDGGDDADHAGRRQRKAAVAPEFGARHSEEEVSQGRMITLRPQSHSNRRWGGGQRRRVAKAKRAPLLSTAHRTRIARQREEAVELGK